MTEEDDDFFADENEAVKTFEGLKKIAMPMVERDCSYITGLGTAASNAVLALTDDQITEMYGTWQELLNRKKEGNLTERQERLALINDVKWSADCVVDLVTRGRTFEYAVEMERNRAGSWLGLVPWVEVKRQAREILAK